MTGADLKRLASTADVAKLDFGESAIELVATGEELSALYVGGYVLARAATPIQSDPFAVHVGANQLQKLAGIFDDDEQIDLAPLSTAVRLSSNKRKNLVLHSTPTTPELIDPEPEELMFSATVDAHELRTEISTTANFVADPLSHNQLLTGVRIRCNSKALGFMAYDGSTALFTTSLSAVGTGSGDVTVPATELVNGLRLLDGQVTVAATSHRLFLIGQTGRFDSVTFEKTWPDYEERLRAHKEYAFTITLSSADIKTVLSAAKHLDSSRFFEVESKGTCVNIRTMQTSLGQLSMEVDNASQAEGLWRYSLKAMANVAKLHDTVTLQIPNNPEYPTHVRVGARRCWFNAYKWTKA